MKKRMFSNSKSLIKNVSIFCILALLPATLLFAGQLPQAKYDLYGKTKIEKSEENWKKMTLDVAKILNKADRLSDYHIK